MGDRTTNSLIQLGAADLPDGVVFEVIDTAPGRHLRLCAEVAQNDISSGWFSTVTVGVPLLLADTAAEPRLLGLAFTQFALPVVAGPSLDFDFRPAPNLHSPPALGLLLVTDGTRTTLVAPLEGVHEQIVGIRDGAMRWGWHGDLDEAPAGFSCTVGIYDGVSSTEVLEAWSAELQALPPRRRDANPITSHLSYWTDNGAAYWYRTEPGRTIGASVTDAVVALRAEGVPVHAVELDSWCYVHETPRPIAEIGYPEEVPPTGMMSWTPRGDVFDTTIEDFRAGVSDAPLVIHSRHISPASPYLDQG